MHKFLAENNMSSRNITSVNGVEVWRAVLVFMLVSCGSEQIWTDKPDNGCLKRQIGHDTITISIILVAEILSSFVTSAKD